MKQPGALFAVFGVLYLLWSQRGELRSRRVEVLLRFSVFTLSGFLPFATMCLILLHAGVFPKFWFWTVTYAHAYGSVISPSGAVWTFLHKIRQRPTVAFVGAAGMVRIRHAPQR
jgi:cytochrome bd-type quinol oxidase subunit 2